MQMILNRSTWFIDGTLKSTTTSGTGSNANEVGSPHFWRSWYDFKINQSRLDFKNYSYKIE